MVVSRKRSCCSSRARFFLYFATCCPLQAYIVGCVLWVYDERKSVTLMARVKTCQGRLVKRVPSESRLKVGWTVNASKTCMAFFQKKLWEQTRRQGCLRGSLSGKGQKLLSALVPAPGGDQ